MTPGRLLLTLAGLALAGTAPASAQRPAKCAKRIAEVRSVEATWLATYETRDAVRMEALLTDDFTITHTNGSIQSQAEVLDQLRAKAGQPGPRFVSRDVQGRCYPGTVVLVGWVGEVGGRESRYTDTYVRLDGRWKVAASHLSRPRTDTR